MTTLSPLVAGDTWSLAWQFPDDFDLSPMTARLQFRPRTNPALMALDCSSANGRMVVDAIRHRVDLLCPKEATGLKSGVYLLQLELTRSDGYRMSLPEMELAVAEDRTKD